MPDRELLIFALQLIQGIQTLREAAKLLQKCDKAEAEFLQSPSALQEEFNALDLNKEEGDTAEDDTLQSNLQKITKTMEFLDSLRDTSDADAGSTDSDGQSLQESLEVAEELQGLLILLLAEHFFKDSEVEEDSDVDPKSRTVPEGHGGLCPTSQVPTLKDISI